MPRPLTLATQSDAGFEAHRKATRGDVFLAEMDKVVPWAELCAVIEPFYPKPRADGGGRPTVGLERMLRIHFLQQWYALSDPAVEEALYDSAAMRRFAGIDLGREGAPDETTVCKFRHLLERHGRADQLFAAVGAHLKRHGFKLSQGTIVDATIIAAAPSTKNRAKARDKVMHQTKKGHQWHFGMKAHIGVDAESGLVHPDGAPWLPGAAARRRKHTGTRAKAVRTVIIERCAPRQNPPPSLAAVNQTITRCDLSAGCSSEANPKDWSANPSIFTGAPNEHA